MKNLKVLATRSIGRSSLILKKYSPEILMGVGIASGVAAGVLAVRATLKVEPVLDQLKENLDTVERANKETDASIQTLNKLKGQAYGMGVVEIAKIYWPAVSLGVASIACIVGSHGIMKKRNAAIVVAYNALEKTFAEYRDRVEEKLGESAERDIQFDIRDKEVVDEETGKKKVVSTLGDTGVSQYAKFFDELSQYWDNTPEYNITFVRAQQNFANDLLQSRGHVFLNEVYESLGLPHTPGGSITGWVLNGSGDQFIDFGIYDPENDLAREFVNGYEKAILLDFNVDGVIWDKI